MNWITLINLNMSCDWSCLVNILLKHIKNIYLYFLSLSGVNYDTAKKKHFQILVLNELTCDEFESKYQFYSFIPDLQS